MARAIAFVCGMSLGAALTMAVMVSHADEANAEVTAAAAKAGVDPTDLLGAVNTTQLDPLEYLYRTGELERPTPSVPISGAVARARCIIGKESGGLDVPNARGSGASGPGQYFASTWARHTALYRQATGYLGSLSLHALADVERVMAFMLANYPSSRAEWSVSGC